MHVVATNLCVWIRTLVLESLKEITQYHKKLGQVQAGILGKRSIYRANRVASPNRSSDHAGSSSVLATTPRRIHGFQYAAAVCREH
jgi:hypothetical protein